MICGGYVLPVYFFKATYRIVVAALKLNYLGRIIGRVARALIQKSDSSLIFLGTSWLGD
jgi:hypothetical protein